MLLIVSVMLVLHVHSVKLKDTLCLQLFDLLWILWNVPDRVYSLQPLSKSRWIAVMLTIFPLLIVLLICVCMWNCISSLSDFSSLVFCFVVCTACLFISDWSFCYLLGLEFVQIFYVLILFILIARMIVGRIIITAIVSSVVQQMKPLLQHIRTERANSLKSKMYLMQCWCSSCKSHKLLVTLVTVFSLPFL